MVGLALAVASHPAAAQPSEAAPAGRDAAPAPAAASRCRLPAGLHDLSEGDLPRTREVLRLGHPFVVVLVGMGSSAGPASEDDGRFGALLARALERRLAGQPVRVVGLGPEALTVKEAVGRLRRAVPDLEPTLVIWRTGTADALAMTDPDRFAHTLRRAAAWLAAQSVDLVLVDLPYHAGSAQEDNFLRYVEALDTAGRGGSIPVFRRYAITRAWATGASPFATQPTPGEGCLTRLLAEAILRRAGDGS